MKKENQTIYPQVFEIKSVDFDSDGFWSVDAKNERFSWKEIEEICTGYWIHEIAIEDFYFTGFRFGEEEKTIWVLEGNDRFDEELKKRFPHGSVPPRNEWKENDRCIQSFVIWPEENVGEIMYSHSKDYWYSKCKLTYKNKANQAVQTTSASARRLS